MFMVLNQVEQLIGHTSIIRVPWHEQADAPAVYVKLESRNPGGSVKDRIALSMINALERDGKIYEKTVLVEPTSGNTGIGLAMVAASRGYQLTLVMPETMTIERKKILQAYGANLVLTDGGLGMKGAIAKAEEIVKNNRDAVMVGQFTNPANPTAHYDTTGPEIWAEMDGNVDVLVAGVGTGGTITGAGRFLKERNPSIQLVAVEPSASPVLSGGQPGPHKIQGIGAGFVPAVLDTELIDKIVQVTEEQAASTTREVAKRTGLLLGYSSGAAVFAGLQQARLMGEHTRIVVISASGGERYLSTDLYPDIMG